MTIEQHRPRAVSDAEVIELLRQTVRQYDKYLELSRIADISKLAAEATSSPFVTEETPLSLVLWPEG